jgi:hypothetical protein
LTCKHDLTGRPGEREGKEDGEGKTRKAEKALKIGK